MADTQALHVPPARPPEIRELGPLLKLARRLPQPVHYALAGGGSHGAVQWGSLQALAETDVRPDAMIGTSAGALTGSVMAEDPVCGLARLSYVWGQLGAANILGEGWLSRQVLTNARQIALIDNQAELETFRDIYTAETFEDLQLPFSAVATDLSTGRPKVLSTGALLPALLASSAIPGVMPPVEIDGRLYCDGLASANLPVYLAVQQGAGSVVVLETGSRDHGEVSKAPAKLISRVANIMNTNQRENQLREAASRVPVVVLPTPSELGSTMDFTESMAAGSQAFQLGRSYLAELALAGRTTLAPGLYGPGFSGELS